MTRIMTNDLERELMELFDIRKAILSESNRLNAEVEKAQKDIKLLILKFSDGIPDMHLKLNDEEALKWNSKDKKLIYVFNNYSQYIESASKETIVRVTPHLKVLVRMAKSYYEELNHHM